jgi:predicted metal-dependent hydrolase
MALIHTPSSIVITPRNPSFDFSGVPKVWMSDAITTHFMNSLSIFIPFSERSVSEILRKNIDSITNHELNTQVKDMIKQEGHHAAMHRASNTYIRQCYSGLNIIEKVQSYTIRSIRKLSSTAFEMSIPAAFEHFTSAVSREIIENKSEWTGCKDNEAINFTLWHCLEELEHQAICYDAYKALYTSRFRLFASLALWVPLSIVSIYSIQFYFLHKDRVIYKPKNWLPYFKFLIKSSRLFYKGTFSFCKKGFNPWSQNDQQLYAKALTEFSLQPKTGNLTSRNNKNN